MLKRYLECGRIVSTHGVRGEMKVEPWCDSAEYLRSFKTLYFDGKGEKPVLVKAVREHKGMALVTLEGVDDMDAAIALRGRLLYLDRNDAPKDDKPFLQDLIGLSVTDIDSGRVYGTLHDVLETGANNVYDIRDEDGKQRLVPAIDDVIIETDFEAGIMHIRPLEGLFDED